MSAIEVAQLLLAAVAGIGVPFAIYRAGRQDRDRAEKHGETQDRLTHLDDCLDSLKTIVIGQAVTRSDLAAFKVEITEILTRMRTAISSETHSIHERINRLENKYFKDS